MLEVEPESAVLWPDLEVIPEARLLPYHTHTHLPLSGSAPCLALAVLPEEGVKCLVQILFG